MDDLFKLAAFAFSFVVLLPLFIYFVLLSAAPKKTKNEKFIVFALTILSVGFMLWTTYKQEHSNEVQTIILGLVFVVAAFINIFEIRISKTYKIGILVLGLGIYVAAGGYV